MRGCLGHQDWGYLGRSKFYAHQEKGVFFKKKKVLKLIWGKKSNFDDDEQFRKKNFDRFLMKPNFSALIVS